MSGAFEIVMQERKALVDKIIAMMQQGEFYNNKPEWERYGLRPWNPLSNVQYRGGNRMRLMATVIDKGYTDPRWATANQYNQHGFKIRKGEHGVLCEKWIFDKQKKTKDEHGNIILETVPLERPQVSYFRVFNGEQVEGFPEFNPRDKEGTELGMMIDRLIDTSECQIREVAQERAYYSPGIDVIFLPPRSRFKDETSFAKTLLHEMAHSTGAATRLNRLMDNDYGSYEYAREELRAEIGALFTETDLDISLAGEHYEDHSDYLKSWIRALKDDYNEFFRACADAEKIATRLVSNYTKKYELNLPEKEVQVTIPAAGKDMEKQKIAEAAKGTIR